MGKTALIQVFLNQYGKKELKPSAPLEYSFGRKAAAVGGSKELAHVYEVGGGKAFYEMAAIPVDSDKLPNTLVVVVLDLSKLHNILSSLEYWLEAVETQLRSRLKAKSKTESGLGLGTLQATQEQIWQTHDDRKYLKTSSAALLLVAHKFDVFIKEDPYAGTHPR